MKELVEFIAKALVDHPDQVEVTEFPSGGRIVVRLQVPQEEMGRVIGKDGNIAQAIRVLLKVAATRQGDDSRQPSLIISPLENGSAQQEEVSDSEKDEAPGDDEPPSNPSTGLST